MTVKKSKKIRRKFFCRKTFFHVVSTVAVVVVCVVLFVILMKDVWDKYTAKMTRFFLKNGPNLASFCLFSFFSHDKYSAVYSTNLTVNDKSVDGVFRWSRTRCGRMVGADESTELLVLVNAQALSTRTQ